jgi:hypothetical protein
MFCGWNAYDQRTHLIAESESGRYYEVSEPWGAFRPYGKLGRIQYDVYNHMVSKHIDHILSHTKHEPVNRVFVVQEFWPKQYICQRVYGSKTSVVNVTSCRTITFEQSAIKKVRL